MGGESSKPESEKSFGKITEFWFLVQPISLTEIKSAEDLYNFIAETLQDELKARVVGVCLPDLGNKQEKLAQGQGFIYCDNLKSAKLVSAVVRSREYIGNQRITVLEMNNDQESDTVAQSKSSGPMKKRDDLSATTASRLGLTKYSSHYDGMESKSEIESSSTYNASSDTFNERIKSSNGKNYNNNATCPGFHGEKEMVIGKCQYNLDATSGPTSIGQGNEVTGDIEVCGNVFGQDSVVGRVNEYHGNEVNGDNDVHSNEVGQGNEVTRDIEVCGNVFGQDSVVGRVNDYSGNEVDVDNDVHSNEVGQGNEVTGDIKVCGNVFGQANVVGRVNEYSGNEVNRDNDVHSNEVGQGNEVTRDIEVCGNVFGQDNVVGRVNDYSGNEVDGDNDVHSNEVGQGNEVTGDIKVCGNVFGQANVVGRINEYSGNEVNRDNDVHSNEVGQGNEVTRDIEVCGNVFGQDNVVGRVNDYSGNEVDGDNDVHSNEVGQGNEVTGDIKVCGNVFGQANVVGRVNEYSGNEVNRDNDVHSNEVGQGNEVTRDIEVCGNVFGQDNVVGRVNDYSGNEVDGDNDVHSNEVGQGNEVTGDIKVCGNVFGQDNVVGRVNEYSGNEVNRDNDVHSNEVGQGNEVTRDIEVCGNVFGQDNVVGRVNDYSGNEVDGDNDVHSNEVGQGNEVTGDIKVCGNVFGQANVVGRINEYSGNEVNRDNDVHSNEVGQGNEVTRDIEVCGNVFGQDNVVGRVNDYSGNEVDGDNDVHSNEVGQGNEVTGDIKVCGNVFGQDNVVGGVNEYSGNGVNEDNDVHSNEVGQGNEVNEEIEVKIVMVVESKSQSSDVGFACDSTGKARHKIDDIAGGTDRSGEIEVGVEMGDRLKVNVEIGKEESENVLIKNGFCGNTAEANVDTIDQENANVVKIDNVDDSNVDDSNKDSSSCSATQNKESLLSLDQTDTSSVTPDITENVGITCGNVPVEADVDNIDEENDVDNNVESNNVDGCDEEDVSLCSARQNEESLSSLDQIETSSVVSDVDSMISLGSTVSNLQEEDSFTVIVSELPKFVQSDKKLYNRFNAKCSGVIKAYLIKKPCCGEIVFNTKKEMEMCVKRMNRATPFGAENGQIRVRVKKKRKQGKNEKKLHIAHQEIVEQQKEDDEQRKETSIEENQDGEQPQPRKKERQQKKLRDKEKRPCVQLQQQEMEEQPHQLKKKQEKKDKKEKKQAQRQAENVDKPYDVDNNVESNNVDDYDEEDVSSCSARQNEESLSSLDQIETSSIVSDIDSMISLGSTVSNLQEEDSFTVIVSELPKFVQSDKILYNRFNAKCSGVIKAYLIKKPCCGEIVFNTKKEMEMCVKRMNRATPFGAENGQIRVRVKKKRKQGKNEKKLHIAQQEIVQQQKGKDHQQRKETSLEQNQNGEQPQPRKKERQQKKLKDKEKQPCTQLQQQEMEEQPHQLKKKQEKKDKKEKKQAQRQAENVDKPYVVVSNVVRDVQMEELKMVFQNECQGVAGVEKMKGDLVRVYFHSVDLAEAAVNVASHSSSLKKFVRKVSVKLGLSASQEIKNRELEHQLEDFIALMTKKRVELLAENTKKLKNIRMVLEELYRSNSKQKHSFNQLKDEIERLETYQQKSDELEKQRVEFEQKYEKLRENVLREAKQCGNDVYGVKKVLEKYDKVIKREMRRFGASLPIYAKRQEIVESVRGNQVIVLIGETGSGKSTQLAQYLADELCPNGSIVVTQPRKIAAVSLAKRVAEEYGCQVGKEVGYRVGLKQKVSGNTIIKFVTDRILLNEVLKDTDNLAEYSCIVIDEAHERSIYTDLLLAMIKQNLSAHPDLKLIVTSATLDTAVFKEYFGNCPVVKVQGRTFPVQRIYEKNSFENYTDQVIDKTVEVCQSGEEGDILIFLTQQNEIERTCEQLKKKLSSGGAIIPRILPLHGKLQAEEQEEVFKATPNGERKIVVATNSAETSITIDGIKIVVDSGMVKEPSFDPERNMITLDVKKVSRSSALQRSGRAGRTAPGKCYCMYTEDEFERMEKNTKPEILKMHLGMAVLQLLSLGVADVRNFDFVEAPPAESLAKAQESLKVLGAIEEDGTLTEQGRMMLELPTDPKLSKALLEGLKKGCGDKIITVIALMSSGRDVFYRGDTAEKKNTCAILKQEFCRTSGDLLSALEVYTLWSKQPRDKQNRWCMENALNAKTLRGTRETIDEIKDILRKLNVRNFDVTSENIEQDLPKSLLAGYSENVAWSLGHEKLGYAVVASNQNTRLHPSSVLSSLGSQPQWVLFQEMRRTSEVFLLNVTPIEYEWLAEVAMHMLQYIDEEEIERKQAKRDRIQPVGPSLVRFVIGPRGSTLRQIENSVLEHAQENATFHEYPSQSRVCLIDCNVDEGLIDIFAPAHQLVYARTKVGEAIAKKRDDILKGSTEVLVSNVGYLKAMVGNDMCTRLILQPGEYCKFDIFIEKEDKTCDVDPDDVLFTLERAGIIFHSNISQNQRDPNKWGSVTFSNPEQAKEARRVIEKEFDEEDMPVNVEKITLRPSRVERIQPLNSGGVSGTRVLVTWCPFPSTGTAYIKCTNFEVANSLIAALNKANHLRASRNKKSGDVKVSISDHDDTATLRKEIISLGFCDAEHISKITVPSSRGSKDVNVEQEEKNVLEFLKMYEKIRVVNRLWVMNSHTVNARVAFLNYEEAIEAIKEFNGKIGQLGARRVYLEMEGKSEITCNTRLFQKLKRTLVKMIEEYDGIEYKFQEHRGRPVKIEITGIDGSDVQILGERISDVLSTTTVTIEEPVVARALSSSYGRNKLKKIENECGAFVQSNMMVRCVNITGSLEAKEKASVKVRELVKELEKTNNAEILLKGSDVPVGAIRRILQEYGKDLKELVKGNDCEATMDIRRRMLVINGVKDDVAKVQKKVEMFLVTMRDTTHTVDGEVCPVCTDEIEQPYRLNICGHSYCNACIDQYVTTTLESTRRNDMFPLKCLYDGCEYLLIREDFLSFLKQDQIELLYRVSFECFLIGNPKVKPCPSPDCSWVYTTTPTPSIFNCPECGTRTCQGCGDVPHEFYDTCEAFKATKDPSKSDELYKKWVASSNTRPCPKCNVMIEKSEGCFHMQCTQCNAHICWICGKLFKTSNACYSHQENCRR